MKITAAEFKARCLALMDEVEATGEEIVITKRGKPVARLVPLEQAPKRPLFGGMKGHCRTLGDIVGPFHDEWDPRG